MSFKKSIFAGGTPPNNAKIFFLKTSHAHDLILCMSDRRAEQTGATQS